MVIQDFSSKLVFPDTAPHIYFIEGQSQYQEILSKIFYLNDKGGFSFVTSSITLPEVLVKPLREGKTDIAQQYRDILTKAPGIEVLDVTSSISEIAQFNSRTPDAIQLATSIEVGADFFLPNDMQLKVVNSIKVVAVSELQ